MTDDGAWQIGDQAVLQRADFGQLIEALREQGYLVVGPTLKGKAIVYGEIERESQLPAGWTDEQDAGTYRLERRDDGALFGYVAGVQSWRPYLFQPHRTLWRAYGSAADFVVEPVGEEIPRMAFLGMRACELNAVFIQDHVFVDGAHRDVDYAARREAAFFIAVNCGKAGGTCFCTSMNTGPRVETGYDLALTEIVGAERHYFLVQIGSLRGALLAQSLPLVDAGEEDVALADAIVERTSSSMGRKLETEGLKALLQENLEHPHWDDVAERCLACANCTMVCPTCFCHTTEDVTDLEGKMAEREQRWDSCFNLDFSYIRGGSVRPGVASRYRQWMTHKLANWIDQFGESGCVGCGRCISWCPAGIDITAEAAAIRASVEGSEDHGNA